MDAFAELKCAHPGFEKFKGMKFTGISHENAERADIRYELPYQATRESNGPYAHFLRTFPKHCFMHKSRRNWQAPHARVVLSISGDWL